MENDTDEQERVGRERRELEERKPEKRVGRFEIGKESWKIENRRRELEESIYELSNLHESFPA